MVNITNTIKSKYYTYVPGEFMPVYVDGQLANRASFHAYKMRRTLWRIQNPGLTYRQFTHHAG